MVKTGRPPAYSTPEEMQKKIDKYFEDCEGELLQDENGKPVLNKYGIPVRIGYRPPTVTGLALALGFTGRQALLNYQAKPSFVDTVTRAKSRIEQYTEERLFDKDGVQGAKFSLKNNFKGWSETPEREAPEDTRDDPLTEALREEAERMKANADQR